MWVSVKRLSTKLRRTTLASLALLACSGSQAGESRELLRSLEPDASAPIQTDTTLYRWSLDGSSANVDIGIEYTNVTPDTISIVNCNGLLPAVLEKRAAGSWIRFWSPMLAECLSPPIRIAPGAVLARMLQVYGNLPGSNAVPAFQSDDLQGVFRITVEHVVWSYDENLQGFGDLVPVERRQSNSFVLVDPRR